MSATAVFLPLPARTATDCNEIDCGGEVSAVVVEVVVLAGATVVVVVLAGAIVVVAGCGGQSSRLPSAPPGTVDHDA